jgi:hypothetical protein
MGANKPTSRLRQRAIAAVPASAAKRLLLRRQEGGTSQCLLAEAKAPPILLFPGNVGVLAGRGLRRQAED